LVKPFVQGLNLGLQIVLDIFQAKID